MFSLSLSLSLSLYYLKLPLKFEPRVNLNILLKYLLRNQTAQFLKRRVIDSKACGANQIKTTFIAEQVIYISDVPLKFDINNIVF